MEKLNILEFKTTSGNQYIYDPCSNRIFYAPEPLKTIVNQFYSYSKDDFIKLFKEDYSEDLISEYYYRVHSLINNHNAFYINMKNVDKKEVTNFTEDEYWSKFNNYSSYTLILSVTESCNLRCNYCVYGGSYRYQRVHNNKNMSFSIAKKSIDYFLKITDDKKRIVPLELGKRVVGFYGGEPLLKYDLIKKCINYVRNVKNLPAEYLRFQMTINGTLLNEEIIDYLKIHDITLVISLDGPQVEHDRNRRDYNGKGTFNIVMRNIMRIKEKYPDFAKKMFVKPTFDFKTDLISVNKFFTNEDLGSIFLPTLASMNNTDYYDQFTNDERSLYFKRMKELEDEYYDAQHNTSNKNEYFNKYKFMRLLFERSLLVYTERSFWTEEQYTACCLPGSKIFVDTKGNIHLCERMNNTFPIGNCDSGLDLNMINNIRQKYFNEVIKKNECWLCENRKLCQSCYATEIVDSRFDTQTRCKDIKKSLGNSFSFIYSKLENNPELKCKIKQITNDKLSITDCTN